MSKEKFRGNENWLEEYLPLKWGGLRVFLWGLAYLLGLYHTITACSLSLKSELFNQEPGIVALLITITITIAGVTCVSVVHFLMESREDTFTRFPWAYLGKYWRNNVISPKLTFSSSFNGSITVNQHLDDWFLIRKPQETNQGVYGPRTEVLIQFTIRLGGWFWRRNAKGWYHGTYIDFSEAIKRRSWYWIDTIGYFSSKEILTFRSFGELMDFLHSDVSRFFKDSLKKYGELTIKVTELEAELKKCRELIREKDMHISDFGRQMLELYQVIAVSIAESSRLAINQESSKLLRRLLVMGMDMHDPLRHEFEHDPLKVDPATNLFLDQICKLCEHYIEHLDEVARKAAQEKELKAKPKMRNPPPDKLPDQQDPPA